MSMSRFSEYLTAFANMADALLGEAKPPAAPGIYGFSFGGELKYIGEAKGRGGLADRILRKHLSGDEGHVLQREFRAQFPDRLVRRQFLRRTIRVKWLIVPPPMSTREIEKYLIALHRPEWNRR